MSGDELTLHFVNYNRKEPEKPRSPGRGIVDENPIAVAGVQVDLVLPAGRRVVRVQSLSPEEPEPRVVKMETEKGRLRFRMPEFLVYGLARIELAPTP